MAENCRNAFPRVTRQNSSCLSGWVGQRDEKLTLRVIIITECYFCLPLRYFLLLIWRMLEGFLTFIMILTNISIFFPCLSWDGRPNFFPNFSFFSNFVFIWCMEAVPIFITAMLRIDGFPRFRK